jgi:hypothetical protein
MNPFLLLNKTSPLNRILTANALDAIDSHGVREPKSRQPITNVAAEEMSTAPAPKAIVHSRTNIHAPKDTPDRARQLQFRPAQPAALGRQLPVAAPEPRPVAAAVVVEQ